MIAAIVMVSAAYLIMFAIVFDYSRWISNWAVCMFLILHAVKTLPASQAVPPISADDRKTTILGWIVTVDSAGRDRKAILIESQIRDRLIRTYSAPSPPWPIWASSKPTTSERNSGRLSHCGTWRRNTPRSDSASRSCPCR